MTYLFAFWMAMANPVRGPVVSATRQVPDVVSDTVTMTNNYYRMNPCEPRPMVPYHEADVAACRQLEATTKQTKVLTEINERLKRIEAGCKTTLSRKSGYIPIPHPDDDGIIVNGDGTLWMLINGEMFLVDETGRPKKDGAP